MSTSDRPTTELATDPLGARGEDPALPLVVVSSTDPGGLQRLSLRLYGRARVVPVRSPLDLRRLARKHVDCIVLLDAAAPELDPLDAATALGVLGPRAVVVWGAAPALREDLAEAKTTGQWIHVGIDTEAAELAELLSSLFE